MLNSAIAKHTHSQFQNVYGPLPATVCTSTDFSISLINSDINSEDARVLNIRDGAHCVLENKQGSVTLTAVLSPSVPVGVLWCPKEAAGICGTPQNVLTSGTPQQIGGGPTFNSTCVTVTLAQ